MRDMGSTTNTSKAYIIVKNILDSGHKPVIYEAKST